MARQVVPTCTKVLPLISVTPAEKRKRGAKASQKTGARWAPRSVSVRGHDRKSAKAVADSILLEVEVGASYELLLAIRQSFKDGRYSPLTGMEEVEWQIMLEQFIASEVVVKTEVINIDSD
jgi:hypothetical protein